MLKNLVLIVCALGSFKVLRGATVETADVRAKFELVFNSALQTNFRAAITLQNHSTETLRNWQLHFNFIRTRILITGAQMVKDQNRMGDYYVVRGMPGAPDLAPAEQVTITVDGVWVIKHGSDAPSGYFITFDDAGGVRQALDIPSESVVLPDWKAPAGKDPASLHKVYLQTSIEGNVPLLEPRAGTLVPAPVQFQKSGPGVFTLRADTALIATTADGLAAARFLAGALQPATGLRLEPSLGTGLPGRGIIFQEAPQARAEGYTLRVTSDQITVEAQDAAGYHYAAQTLRQLLPAAALSATTETGVSWTIPELVIVDYPRFGYRGLHLDVARNFMPLADVRRMIDLMALHKLNRLHWHLTDDEGWRIEIKTHPRLAMIGGFRGWNWPLPPSYGSGSAQEGGYYTQEEIRSLVAYARERQITIIPEIDMPGHARAMIKSLPELLLDPADQSEYASVQGYRDNVLSPCLESTFTVIDDVVREVAALFPETRLHIGGDEVPDGVWNPDRSPRCRELMAREQLSSRGDIEHYFVKRVQMILQKHGKSMAGWQEIAQGPGFPQQNVLAYLWKPGSQSKGLLKQGYQLVLTPADFFYFDLAYSDDPKDAGQYWAGTIDTFKAYSYEPVPKSLTADEQKRIAGVQACLWTEVVKGRDAVEDRLFPRLAALAEVAWSPAGQRDWRDFSARLKRDYLPRLREMGLRFHPIYLD